MTLKTSLELQQILQDEFNYYKIVVMSKHKITDNYFYIIVYEKDGAWIDYIISCCDSSILRISQLDGFIHGKTLIRFEQLLKQFFTK